VVGIEALCLAFRCKGGVVGFEKCPVALKHEGWWSIPHPLSHQTSRRNARGLNGGGDSNRPFDTMEMMGGGVMLGMKGSPPLVLSD
jgi:hypothetical protein